MVTEKEVNFVSAVVYVKKGGDSVRDFLEYLFGVFDSRFASYEFVCVNDGAGEEELGGIRQFGQEHGIRLLTVVNMLAGRKGAGLENSMTAGRDAAIGDYIFEFDSTFADYSPQDIMTAYEKCLAGADIVSAVPKQQRTGIFSRMFYRLLNSCLQTPAELAADRFRVLSRRAVNSIEAYSRTVPYRKAVYASSGMKCAAVRYDSGRTGKKLSSDAPGLEAAGDAVILFTDLAYRVSLGFSVMMALLLAGYGIYAVSVHLSRPDAVAGGWASLAVLICAGFLAVFILLAVMFRYLEMLLRLSFKKRQYAVTSVEKL